MEDIITIPAVAEGNLDMFEIFATKINFNDPCQAFLH